MVKNHSFRQDKLMYRLVLNVSQILYIQGRRLEEIYQDQYFI